MAILPQFLMLDLHSCEKVASAILKSQFYASLDIRHSFRAKGSRPKFQKHYTSFWRSSLISFEMVDLILQNSNICVWRSRIAILHQFLPFDLHFVQSCASELSNCQFLTLSPHFMRKGGTTPQKVYISPHVCASDTRGLPRTNKIRMSADVCASDTRYLRRGSRFDGWGLAAPAAKREKVRRTWEIGVLQKFRHN